MFFVRKKKYDELLALYNDLEKEYAELFKLHYDKKEDRPVYRTINRYITEVKQRGNARGGGTRINTRYMLTPEGITLLKDMTVEFGTIRALVRYLNIDNHTYNNAVTGRTITLGTMKKLEQFFNECK